MKNPRSFLANFSLFGLGLLGVIYIAFTFVVWIVTSRFINNEWGIQLGHVELIWIFCTLGCFFSVGWVVRKLWLASWNGEVRNRWIYPSILFISGVSVILFAFNIILFVLMIAPLDQQFFLNLDQLFLLTKRLEGNSTPAQPKKKRRFFIP